MEWPGRCHRFVLNGFFLFFFSLFCFGFAFDFSYVLFLFLWPMDLFFVFGSEFLRDVDKSHDVTAPLGL